MTTPTGSSEVDDPCNEAGASFVHDSAMARVISSGVRLRSITLADGDTSQNAVIAMATSWPWQSTVGELILFACMNTSSRGLAGQTGSRLLSSEWQSIGLDATDRWARCCLQVIYGAIPPPSTYVSYEWVPSPLTWHLGIRGRSLFRGCRQCDSIGYHTPMHSLPWVARCPIHPDEALVECPHLPFGTQWAVRGGCLKCGFDRRRHRLIAMRPVPPADGLCAIARYHDFVRATKAITEVRLSDEHRHREAGTHALEFAQLSFVRARSDQLYAELPKAVFILAVRLGYEDLTRYFAVPSKHRVSYRAIHAAAPDSVADAGLCAAGDGDGGSFLFARGQGQLADRHNRGLENFHARLHDVVRRSTGCPRALQYLRKDHPFAGDPQCSLCVAIEGWREHVAHPHVQSASYCGHLCNVVPKLGRRRPEVGDYLEGLIDELQCLDAAEHFLAFLANTALDQLFAFHPLVQEERQRHWPPFQKLLVFRINGKVEAYVWGETDLGLEIQNIVDTSRCVEFGKTKAKDRRNATGGSRTVEERAECIRKLFRRREPLLRRNFPVINAESFPRS